MFSIIRLELMRLHLRSKRIWKGIIALFITFMVVTFFVAFILASKESSINVLYKVSKLDKPDICGSAIEEAIKFIKFGRVGNIYQLILIITILMIIITLCTGKSFLERVIKNKYHKWLVNPYFSSNVSEFKMEDSKNNVLESINTNVLKLTVGVNTISGKCNNNLFSQTDVIDVNKDYFGRILNVKGNDSNINILLVSNVLNNCMKAQRDLVSVDAEILEGFSLYAKDENSARNLLESEISQSIIELCKQYGSIAVHINGEEITVLYAIARETFSIDMSKKFKYEGEMSKIRNDVSFIKQVCGLLN